MLASRDRAPSCIYASQQSTHGPLTSCRKQNTEMRDLGLKTCGDCAPPPQTTHPRSRVCGISLVITDYGIMCVMLTVADRERARTRKMATGRMAKFDRFLQFSASLEKHLFGKSRYRPKTAEIDQGSEGQRLRVNPANTVGRCQRQLKAGSWLLHVTTQSSQRPPSPKLCVQKSVACRNVFSGVLSSNHTS